MDIINQFLIEAKSKVQKAGDLKPFILYEDLLLIAQKLKEKNNV